MNIKFEEINQVNWEDCISLEVDESQNKFVDRNAFSLVEATYAEYKDALHPLAIYDEDLMVGFLMYEVDDEEQDMGMCRLMLDKKYQNMGYGRKAVQMLIERMINQYGKRSFYTSFVPENTVARKLYTSVGFEDTGKLIEDEILFKFKYEE